MSAKKPTKSSANERNLTQVFCQTIQMDIITLRIHIRLRFTYKLQLKKYLEYGWIVVRRDGARVLMVHERLKRQTRSGICNFAINFASGTV